jgi:hypothetical protein
MGLSVEVVRKPPKPVPEEVAKLWAEEWAKEGKQDEPMDYERLCASAEAFIYAAMIRLMVRRLVRL